MKLHTSHSFGTDYSLPACEFQVRLVLATWRGVAPKMVNGQLTLEECTGLPLLRIHSNFELPTIGRSRRSGRTGDDRIWRTLVETQLAPIESMTDVSAERCLCFFSFLCLSVGLLLSFTIHRPPFYRGVQRGNARFRRIV